MSVTYVSAALRRQVRERARERCEYCLMPEAVVFAPHEIDHIVAEKHGGSTTVDNLCLACSLCNQRKGSDLTSVHPDTSEVVALFHPRRNAWKDHFCLIAGRIEGLSEIGVVTTHFLQCNARERIVERLLLEQAGLYQP